MKANKYVKNLKNPEKYSNEILRLQGSDRFALISGGGYNDKKLIALIINSIQDKSSKFLKYPNCNMFSRRGLYIFDKELRPSMQLLDTESIRKATKDSVFDVVFVHQVHRLIVVEKEDDLAKEYPFDKINLAQAICEAKRVCGSLGIKPYKI